MPSKPKGEFSRVSHRCPHLCMSDVTTISAEPIAAPPAASTLAPRQGTPRSNVGLSRVTRMIRFRRLLGPNRGHGGKELLAGERLPKGPLIAKSKCESTSKTTARSRSTYATDAQARVCSAGGLGFPLELRFPWLRLMRLNSSSSTGTSLRSHVGVPLVWGSCGVWVSGCG